jgi:hypothetical protein
MPEAVTGQTPWRREDLRWELAQHRGERVTVIWCCQNILACSTGRLVEVGSDFVEVHGAVPTFAEKRSSRCCEDFAALDLDIVIPLQHVCAVVECVPECRQATVPACCGGRHAHCHAHSPCHDPVPDADI